MKRPKLPKENPDFWLRVARSEIETNDFLQRGNDRQKKNLTKALKYLKWLKIQEKQKVEYEKA